MNVKWEMSFGDILTIIGAIFVVASILLRGGWRSGSTLTKLESAVEIALAEIGELKTDIKQMGKVLTELAVQKEQITMLTKWYDELRRGVGRVVKGRDD